MATFNEDIHVAGSLSADTFTLAAGTVTNASIASGAGIARSKLATESGKYVIPWMDFRIHDSASNAQLPNTSATDDLGLYIATFGSGSHDIRTYDVKTVGATTLYARFYWPLPAEYVTGGAVTARVYGGMITTVADTTATVDIECYESDKAGGVGSDLCTTGATTINSLTFANVDFTINPAGLVAGDILDFRVAIAINDGAGGTAVIGSIGALTMLADIKG